jgi:hypothetical protein
MPDVLNLDTLPPDVLADLHAAAAKNGTTVEAEATARLVNVIKRDKLPPLGEPIPSPEMSAPYDFPDPSGTPVEVIWHDGPDKFEFWYGEDKVVE